MTRKLTDIQKAEMRRRRAAGEKVYVLALEYGVSSVHAGRICRGIDPERDDVDLAVRVLAIAGRHLGATLEEMRDVRPGRRENPAGPRARAVAVLALRLHLRVTYRAIATALGPSVGRSTTHAMVERALERSKVEREIPLLAIAIAQLAVAAPAPSEAREAA
jgi:hypothetical protein